MSPSEQPTTERCAQKKLFVFAGESSGDLQGSRLLTALNRRCGDLKCFGVGGPKMRLLGVETVLPMEDFQIMGFTGAIVALPRLRRQFQLLYRAIEERQPDGVLLIDYPGLNLKLAKLLRKRGYQGKIVQYISPKVWAWRHNRVYSMADTLDRLLTIFPFESKCYEGTNLSVDYIGNPLTELVEAHVKDEEWVRRMGFSPEHPILGLFPGSRRSEITLNLGRMLRTAERLIHLFPDLQFGLSIANETVRPLVLNALKGIDEELQKRLILVPSSDGYHLMSACHAAIATSGTVTLELALFKVPTVMVYRITWLNALLARFVFRINLPHYCIVNIVAGKTVFPELVHTQFSPKKAVQALSAFLNDTPQRTGCIDGCGEVADLLRAPQEKPASCAHEQVETPSQMGAAVVGNLLQCLC